MRGFLFVFGALAVFSVAHASQRCGNGWIADNKVCRISQGMPVHSPSPAPTYSPAPAYTPYIAAVSVAPVDSRLFQYGNCKSARAAGLYDIPLGSSDYSHFFDRDNDGIACENNGQDDMFVPKSDAFDSDKSKLSDNGQFLESVDAFGAKCLDIPNTNEAGKKDLNGRTDAQPVDVYVVESAPYVIAGEFACVNGYTFEERDDLTKIDSTKRVFLAKGSGTTLDEKSFFLNAKPIMINNRISFYYTDLLNAFGLTVRGQNLHLIPTVIRSSAK